MADTFICGQCSQSYHDISVFLQHKNECSGVVPEIAISSAGEMPQPEAPSITALLVDGGHLDGQLAEGFLNGQQFVVQTAFVNGELSASDATGSVTLVPVTSMSDPTATTMVATDMGQPSDQITWPPPGHHIQHMVMVADPSSRGDSQEPVAVPSAPKTGRKRGRPKKGEGKPKPSEPVEKLAEVQRPSVPEKRADGLYHCPSCKKTFRKERHFTTHKCLATSDYVDITRKEVVDDGDESDVEEDTDSTADFTAYNRGESTGRYVRRRITHSQASAPPLTTSDGTTQVASDHPPSTAETTMNTVIANGAEDVEITPLPVFTEEEDKVMFEQNMNIDLSQVDSMFRTLLIDQDVNDAGMQQVPGGVLRGAGRTAHDQLSIFSCNVCTKVFMSLSHMRQHCLIHTDLKPFKCAKCDYATNTKGNLYTHMRKHTGQMYRCDKCPFTTTNKGHLVEHAAIHSGVRQVCKMCNNDYNTPKSLQNHIRKYHLETKAGRDYLAEFLLHCGKRGAIVNPTHVGTAVLHQCHICNRKFKKKIDCDRHLFVHNIKDNPNVFPCGLCDYAASRRVYLEQHYRRHRIIYTCIRCPGELFPSSIRLRNHLLEHLANEITAAQQFVEVNNEGTVLNQEQLQAEEEPGAGGAESAEMEVEPCNTEVELGDDPHTVKAEQDELKAQPISDTVTVADGEDTQNLVIATTGELETARTFIDAYETYITVADTDTVTVEPSVEGTDVVGRELPAETSENHELVGMVVNADDLEDLFFACIDASFYLAGSSEEDVAETEVEEQEEQKVEGNETEMDTGGGIVEFFNSTLLKGSVEGEDAMDPQMEGLEAVPGVMDSSGVNHSEDTTEHLSTSDIIENPSSFEGDVKPSGTLITSKTEDRLAASIEDATTDDTTEQNVNSEEAARISGTVDEVVNATQDITESLPEHVYSTQTSEGATEVASAVDNSKEAELSEVVPPTITEAPNATETQPDEMSARITGLHEMWKKLGYRPLNMAILQQLRHVFGSAECEFCGRLFSSAADYNSHMHTHTGEKRYTCDQCPYRSHTNGNLKRHIERAHDMQWLACTHCDYVARSRTQLWMHTQRHRQPTVVRCQKCDIIFDSTKRLKIHVQMKHSELSAADIKLMISGSQKTVPKFGRVTHKCPYCEKTFARANSDLRKHIWMHEGIRPFTCPHCPHACRSKTNLQAHLLRHSAHKPFLCNECGKAYKSRTALRWHVRSHTMGRMFKCDRCPYEALQKSHLKRHSETHDVIKRYPCEHCDYSANTLGYLKIHYTRQHYERLPTRHQANTTPPSTPTATTTANNVVVRTKNVFRCLSCDYRFGNLSDLKRHLRTKHRVEASDIEVLSKLSADAVESQQAVSHQVMSHQRLETEEERDGEQATEDVTMPDDFQIINLEQNNLTHEEEETAVEELHYTVDPEADISDQKVPSVNLLQQIIDMSQEGSVKHDQQIMVQSSDGGENNVIAVSPNTIIVQQDDLQQMMMTSDDPSTAGQYIIEYVSESMENNPTTTTQLVGVAEETVAGTEIILDALDCNGATWQIVQQVNAATATQLPNS